MADALLNLVRCDNLDETEGLDVESGSTTYDQAAEIKLVQPDGSPAALPGNPSWISSDVRYEYTGGGVGQAARRRRLQIPIAIDYIGADAHNQLQRWMHDRALVWFNPGFGRFTDFAYRPLIGYGANFADGSTALTDLTGRWDIEAQNNSLNNYVWDADLRVLREWSRSDYRRVIATPFGASECYEPEKINRFTPGYPGGASEGNGASDSGWEKAGAQSSDLTFALESGAFGHDDMPDALRVTSDYYGVSRNRFVRAQSLWISGDANYQGYAFSGSSTVAVSVWVRGRFGPGAQFRLSSPSGTTAIYLDDVDTSEWTKLSVSRSGDWDLAQPLVEFYLPNTGGGDCDFLVGSCTVVSSTGGAHSEPEWSPASTTVDASRSQVANYEFPVAGSVAAAFYVPDGTTWSTSYLLGTSTGPGRLYISSEGTLAVFVHASGGALSGAISLREGAVNTLIATYSTDGTVTIYCNGEQVAQGGPREIGLGGSAVTLYPGATGAGGSWPARPLSFRIDRDVWTADEVAWIDASLRDPVANALSVMARGRKFMITQIPSTPRLQAGGTAWIGQLVLEEHEYDDNFSDITSREVY